MHGRHVGSTEARRASILENGPLTLGRSATPWYACLMGRVVSIVSSLGLLAVLITSCAGQKEATPTTTSSTSTPSTSVSSSTVPFATPTTSSIESLTVTVTASPNPVSPGVPVTFGIQIRGPGTLSVESIAFGDGGTTGANAGMVQCGETAQADMTRAVTHSYTTSGTYQFSDEVGVIGPPPSCASENVTGTATVVVSSPLATANRERRLSLPYEEHRVRDKSRCGLPGPLCDLLAAPVGNHVVNRLVDHMHREAVCNR